MDDAEGPRNCGLEYEKTVAEHYRPFWERGIAVDIINADCDLSGYKLVIAPMLYMVREGFAERATRFVEQGGQFVATYWSGIVNESDLCHLGGFLALCGRCWVSGPKKLTVWPMASNQVQGLAGNKAGLQGPYQAIHLCDLIHLEGRQPSRAIEMTSMLTVRR